MKSTEEIIETIMKAFDEEVADISRSQYIDVMEGLIDDLSTRVDTAQEEEERDEEE